MKDDIKNIILVLDIDAAILSIALMISLAFNIVKTIELLVVFAIIITTRILLSDAMVSKNVSLKLNKEATK